MLDTLTRPLKLVHHPLHTLFFGFLYASIAVLVTLFVFGGKGGLVLVTLTIIPCVHLFYVVLHTEAKKDSFINSEWTLLKEHGKIITFFAFLFLGFIASFGLWFSILPEQTAKEVFSLQIYTIEQINSQPLTGKAYSDIAIFSTIFVSNIKVSLFAVLFSLIYGVGAIFILVWNASVIGAAIGDFVRTNLAEFNNVFGIHSVVNYTQYYYLGLLRFSLHSIPEITAYFIAGLAGAILSIAITKHGIFKHKFKLVLLDVVDLLILSVVLLFFAGLIEVYISPIIGS